MYTEIECVFFKVLGEEHSFYRKVRTVYSTNGWVYSRPKPVVVQPQSQPDENGECWDF